MLIWDSQPPQFPRKLIEPKAVRWKPFWEPRFHRTKDPSSMMSPWNGQTKTKVASTTRCVRGAMSSYNMSPWSSLRSCSHGMQFKNVSLQSFEHGSSACSCMSKDFWKLGRMWTLTEGLAVQKLTNWHLDRVKVYSAQVRVEWWLLNA